MAAEAITTSRDRDPRIVALIQNAKKSFIEEIVPGINFSFWAPEQKFRKEVQKILDAQTVQEQTELIKRLTDKDAGTYPIPTLDSRIQLFLQDLQARISLIDGDSLFQSYESEHNSLLSLISSDMNTLKGKLTGEAWMIFQRQLRELLTISVSQRSMRIEALAQRYGAYAPNLRNILTEYTRDYLPPIDRVRQRQQGQAVKESQLSQPKVVSGSELTQAEHFERNKARIAEQTAALLVTLNAIVESRKTRNQNTGDIDDLIAQITVIQQTNAALEPPQEAPAEMEKQETPQERAIGEMFESNAALIASKYPGVTQEYLEARRGRWAVFKAYVAKSGVRALELLSFPAGLVGTWAAASYVVPLEYISTFTGGVVHPLFQLAGIGSIGGGLAYLYVRHRLKGSRNKPNAVIEMNQLERGSVTPSETGAKVEKPSEV